MLTQLSPPAAEPLTLADAKPHLRVDADITEDDGLIAALIVTARQQAEHRTGRALVTRNSGGWGWIGLRMIRWSFRCRSCSPCSRSRISMPMVFARRWPAWRIRRDHRRAGRPTAAGRFGKTWPDCRIRPGSVQVSYTCGYGAASDVPQSIKAWMLLAIGAWYENREALTSGKPVAELPRSFWDGLLDPFYVPGRDECRKAQPPHHPQRPDCR